MFKRRTILTDEEKRQRCVQALAYWAAKSQRKPVLATLRIHYEAKSGQTHVRVDRVFDDLSRAEEVFAGLLKTLRGGELVLFDVKAHQIMKAHRC